LAVFPDPLTNPFQERPTPARLRNTRRGGPDRLLKSRMCYRFSFPLTYEGTLETATLKIAMNVKESS
jgi:hypothetical protein